MNFCHGKEGKENLMNKMASTFSDIKKRENIRQNEVLYVTTPNDKTIPNEFGDRFIPRRYAFDNLDMVLNRGFSKHQMAHDVLETRLQAGYWRKFNYNVEMSNIFDFKIHRTYQFNDKLCINMEKGSRYKVNPLVKNINYINSNKEELDWQCKPRAKPSAFIDSTHDLPGFKLHSSKQIIDWSRKGQIGASFGRDLVIWTCLTDTTVVYHTKMVSALRFSPDGNSLALGSEKAKKPIIQIWSMKKFNAKSNLMHNFLCLKDSFLLSDDIEEIMCIEWCPQGKFILCGMNCGKIYVIDSIKSETIVLCNHSNSINAIKFNVNAKYFATSDHIGMVIISKWTSCKVFRKLSNKICLAPNKAIIDWHPWSPTDIAIAKSLSISIVNIQTDEIVAYYNCKGKNCTIEAMAFNKISAEMVVSYSIKIFRLRHADFFAIDFVNRVLALKKSACRRRNTDSDGCVTFEILVMASLDRIVDVLKCHEDRVRFLLFSPDGQQLATAGDDDMMSIFNFFTNPNCGVKRSLPKSSKTNLARQSEIFKTLIR